MTSSRRRATAAAGLVLAAFVLAAPAASGQAHPATAPAGAQTDTAAREPAGAQTDTVAGLRVGGPAVPVAPAVIARDAAGRVTVRAVRIATPLDIDGRLDEAVYARVPAMSGFIQTDPDEGAPATEKTEIWLLFDDDNVYVVGRCWETEPERLMANEMRRDNPAIVRNDNLAWSFDTFHDRRNGVIFEVNPIGGRLDGEITNEERANIDWNPVWDVAAGLFEQGYVVEAAIPFKSLRYRPGREQTWGFQVRRRNRWKNELSYLAPIPAAWGERGHFRMSLSATVVGLEAPPGSRSIEIKPYAIADLTSDATAATPVSNALGADAGIDVKYGITQNLTADVTVNTDFAQVEADEQQINLTRFSLFFPEKREFFLENQGLFTFGGAGAGPFGAGDTPVLFYSRRIGLDAATGREIPIDVGGRMTGRVGAFSVGLLNIRTGDAPEAAARATNFSVVRLKRDLLRRSSVGAIFTRRSVSSHGPGASETYGVDGTFAFYDALSINTYWARTRTPDSRLLATPSPDAAPDDVSYRAQLNYAGDRYGVELEHLVVGTDFNPEVGFLRREDFARSYGLFRFSPRPQALAAIRKLIWEGRFDYITDRRGVLETRQAFGQFGIEFENSDRLTFDYTRNYEYLDRPFRIARDVAIPVGGYRFQDLLVSFELGRQRRFSGLVSAQHGGFFGGTKTSLGFGLGGGISSGRLEITRQLSFEPGLSINRIALPQGRFTTNLVTTRTTYTVTPLMFFSALVQYNSANASLGANLRFRWEYQPGSELFVVYNEQRDTLVPRFPGLENRAVVVKINRLFRF